MNELSPIIYRGEQNGILRQDAGYKAPFFFAEDFNQAKLYAGKGTEPIACVIVGQAVLDLTSPDYRNEHHQSLVKKLKERFDNWTCRTSGEPREPWDYLECGDLYDYEGTGSGERWRALFDIALDDMGFDAVRVLDRTDGTNGIPVPVWVTQSRANIRELTPGELLVEKLKTQTWDQTRAWLKDQHPDLLTRISRLTCLDEQYRADNVHEYVPPDNFSAMSIEDGPMTIWRALPSGKDIRPGDWIALTEQYAGQHQHQTSFESSEVKSLARVSPSDIYWAGTDEREFFYLPAAWRLEGASTQEYLESLNPEQIRMLCDGEQSSITQHQDAIESIKKRVLKKFDHEATGDFHGPDHWNRVCNHGHAVSRAMGIDPLVPHIFAWVHDSQREHDGYDTVHGREAVVFIHENRETLFAFLSDEQISELSYACELHSDGETEGGPLVRACWDADRLDLWRVDITPNPRYMCTPYGKDQWNIEKACDYSDRDREANGITDRLFDREQY